MRNDLSFLLERPYEENSPSLPALYSSGSQGGINLNELWLYYNIWGEMKQGPPTHADGTSFPANTRYIAQSPDVPSSKIDPFYNYTFLTKLEARYAFSLLAEERTVGGVKQYKLFLVFDPVISIWNPFNVSYHIPRTGFNSVKFWTMPYNLNLKIGDNNISRPFGGDRSPTGIIRRDNFLTLSIGEVENLVMRPGEVQIISQGLNAALVPSGFSVLTDGKLGWSDTGGFKAEIKVPETNGTPDFTINGTDKITFSITANEKFPNGLSSITHISHVIGEGIAGNTSVNQDVGRFSIGRNAIKKASEIPWIFPGLDELESFSRTVESIAATSPFTDASKKWPIAIITHGVRTELDSGFTASYSGTRRTSKPFLRMNSKVRDTTPAIRQETL